MTELARSTGLLLKWADPSLVNARLQKGGRPGCARGERVLAGAVAPGDASFFLQVDSDPSSIGRGSSCLALSCDTGKAEIINQP